MTAFTIKPTSAFRKDYKRAIKQGHDIALLDEVIALLASGKPLPERYRDHKLSGN
ncbi:MAG: type II toxin-antitoxin system YafQ family toxin [Oxalobacter sp.]|nr:type II toxin-antitoxin system YafQ family toxin [Oxalobacter sp.]